MKDAWWRPEQRWILRPAPAMWTALSIRSGSAVRRPGTPEATPAESQPPRGAVRRGCDAGRPPGRARVVWGPPVAWPSGGEEGILGPNARPGATETERSQNVGLPGRCHAWGAAISPVPPLFPLHWEAWICWRGGDAAGPAMGRTGPSGLTQGRGWGRVGEKHVTESEGQAVCCGRTRWL